MKRIIAILGFMFLVPAAVGGAKPHGDFSELWDKANTLYINADYGGAITLYDSIVAQGYGCGKLYYNLGNAHFKSNNIGRAILNYNRALEYSPNDKDIQYNLAVANSYIKDRIEPVPEFFLSGWTRAIRAQLSGNEWAVVSLVMFAAALAMALLYLLGQKKSMRKAGFFTGIAFALLFVGSVYFSVAGKRDLIDASKAIVIADAVSVKSSPDRSSKDLFILHEGTMVEVVTALNGWTEIMIADGNKGWLLTDAIEKIN